MRKVSGAPLAATVKRPSELDSEETKAWLGFMASSAPLGRAFLSPRFARACENAFGRVRVAVLHDDEGPCAFLPYRFPTAAHEACRAAESAGGGLADHALLVARPGFRVEPSRLLQLCRLGSLFVPQLSPGQDAFGLAAAPVRIGHVIDLSEGPAAYMAALAARDRAFVQDTERRARRIEKEFGRVEFAAVTDPPAAAVEDLIEAKRAQYRRTAVDDPLASEESRRLLLGLARDGGDDCRVILTTLTAGGRTLARHLGLMHRGTLSYWFPVYDEEARRVSPGRMLLWHTIRAAGSHGITFIDRGGGDTQAKRDFSTGTVTFGVAHWQAPGPLGWVARLWQSAHWRLRR